jgi:hypothetical protein
VRVPVAGARLEVPVNTLNLTPSTTRTHDSKEKSCSSKTVESAGSAHSLKVISPLNIRRHAEDSAPAENIQRVLKIFSAR